MWAVRLPCKSRALPALPREEGCWVRSQRGCPRNGSAGGLMRNWSRVPESVATAPRALDWCIVVQQNAADRRCFTPRQLKQWHAVESVALQRPASEAWGEGCTLVQQALPWQVPKSGLCFSVGARPPASRYLTNHGHQAELLLPRAAAMRRCWLWRPARHWRRR